MTINHSRGERVTRTRQALTLIELLVAMSIAVLLAAVVFAIYAAALRALDTQSRWRAGAYPAAAALDTLALDLAGAVIPWGVTNAPFVLESGREDADGIKLRFFTAAPLNAAQTQNVSRSEWDARAYSIRKTEYFLPVFNAAGANGSPSRYAERDRDQRARHALGMTTNATIRVRRMFRIDYPGGVASNADVWPNVRAISLEVYDGNLWTNTWGEGTNAVLPRAARVTLAVGDESAGRRTAEIMIPAGQRIAPPKTRK